ncbi:MAG: response regulator transcription factor [Actinobacteria bacterium]|nr:response regulator transcription factor [Actinomycetota bacterium]
MSQILIVEDEPRIAAFIAKGLRSAGFTTLVEPSGEAAVSLALTEPVDLVVLDVGLPDIDGFEVLARLRGQGSAVPVIMLTARSSVADRVTGLQSGADDYMPKPFAFEELLARIQVRLRPDSGSDQPMVLAHGDLSLDLRTRRASVAGRSVDLTAREFTLAEMFLRNPGMVLSREQLLSGAWGYDFDPGSNVVDVYVRYLRRKLGADYFETVRGMGYRLS